MFELELVLEIGMADLLFYNITKEVKCIEGNYK
jgi:hypothetical protein